MTHSRVMRSLVAVLALITAVGIAAFWYWFPIMGDRVIEVEGTLVREGSVSAEMCRLDFHYGGTEEVYSTAQVRGDFGQIFVVGNERRTHVLKLYCPMHAELPTEVFEIRDEVEGGVSHFDLGSIEIN